MTPHRVLCFGGRDYADRAKVDEALRALAVHLGPVKFAIIHGGARGADSLCGHWGNDMGHPVIIVPAPWDTFGKGAGHTRNEWMADILRPTYAVGFPGGAGTADMLRRLKARGVPVWML